MDKQQVFKILETITYPDFKKNIVELKLIDSLHVKPKSLHVKINTDNENAFNFIARAIPKLFKNDFRDIEVEKKLKEIRNSFEYNSTKKTNNKAPYAKKVIVISSGKGGVGKSTVSTNFALSLAQEGYKVGLLDANVYGPSIPRIFGIENEKLQWNDKNKIIPHENFDVKVMSTGFTTPTNDNPLVWSSSVAISTLMRFLENVEWGELDFLVIDMPSKATDIQLNMTKELPLFGAILVTTPQILACDDVNRSVMMFKDLHVKILGIVENMSYFIAPDTGKRYDIFGKDGAKNICEKYNLTLLSQIPLDMSIREMSDDGEVSVALIDETIKKSYKKIVKKVLEEV